MKDQAVILGGNLHEDGGNPIVDKKGEVVAETEREELLLNDKQTSALEKHAKLYEETNDKVHFLHMGEIMKEVIDNVIDQSKD